MEDNGRMEKRRTHLATAEHCAQLAKLQADFNAEFGSPCPAEQILARRLRGMLAGPHCYAVLAGPASQPSGHAIVTLRPTIYSDGPLAVLDELYVRPPLRGQGIGGAILDHVLIQLAARGGSEMHINVDEDDAQTRRFYEDRGFVNHAPGSEWRMLLYLQELPTGP